MGLGACPVRGRRTRAAGQPAEQQAQQISQTGKEGDNTQVQAQGLQGIQDVDAARLFTARTGWALQVARELVHALAVTVAFGWSIRLLQILLIAGSLALIRSGYAINHSRLCGQEFK